LDDKEFAANPEHTQGHASTVTTCNVTEPQILSKDFFFFTIPHSM
jgi:hypothetical protein